MDDEEMVPYTEMVPEFYGFDDGYRRWLASRMRAGKFTYCPGCGAVTSRDSGFCAACESEKLPSICGGAWADGKGGEA